MKAMLGIGISLAIAGWIQIEAKGAGREEIEAGPTLVQDSPNPNADHSADKLIRDFKKGELAEERTELLKRKEGYKEVKSNPLPYEGSDSEVVKRIVERYSRKHGALGVQGVNKELKANEIKAQDEDLNLLETELLDHLTANPTDKSATRELGKVKKERSRSAARIEVLEGDVRGIHARQEKAATRKSVKLAGSCPDGKEECKESDEVEFLEEAYVGGNRKKIQIGREKKRGDADGREVRRLKRQQGETLVDDGQLGVKGGKKEIRLVKARERKRGWLGPSLETATRV